MSNLDSSAEPVTLAAEGASGPAVHRAADVLEARKAAGRFGEVPGDQGEPLAAPPLPGVPLRPR
jgi:hypothetical protein